MSSSWGQFLYSSGAWNPLNRLGEHDTIHIEINLNGGHVSLTEEYDVETWIGNHEEVMEAIAAKRMGWA